MNLFHNEPIDNQSTLKIWYHFAEWKVSTAMCIVRRNISKTFPVEQNNEMSQPLYLEKCDEY